MPPLSGGSGLDLGVLLLEVALLFELELLRLLREPFSGSSSGSDSDGGWHGGSGGGAGNGECGMGG